MVVLFFVDFILQQLLVTVEDVGLLLFRYSSCPLVQPSSIKQKILDSCLFVFLSIFGYVTSF